MNLWAGVEAEPFDGGQNVVGRIADQRRRMVGQPQARAFVEAETDMERQAGHMPARVLGIAGGKLNWQGGRDGKPQERPSFRRHRGT